MRVDLRDGQWAVMRERINHGQDKAIRRATVAGRASPDEAWEVPTIVVRVFVREWEVRDPDGAVIDLGDADAIDRAPDDVVDELFAKAWELYTGATVPSAATPPRSPPSSSEE